MKLDERKLKILQAIIGDFISTAEPVGSRTLAKKYDLGISPATIRNEMADLEDLGFLTHPHTSAGRVPSAKAYRFYVNEMMMRRELSQDLKEAIGTQIFSSVSELDKAVAHAAKILSEITQLTSFALTPNKEQDILSHVNLMAIDNHRILLTIVSDSGRISNNIVETSQPCSNENLNLLAKTMTYNYRGKTLSQALTMDIINSFETDAAALHILAESIAPDFLKTLEEMLNTNLYMDGLSNIFNLPEYNTIDKAKMFVETLSHRETLTEKLRARNEGITITIGEENDEEALRDCSLITAL